MLLTPRPDGSLWIEVRADHFTSAWKAAPQDRRVVLSDGRPAVYAPDEQNQATYTTPLPFVWDIMKRQARGRTPASRERLCEQCGSTLTLAWEESRHWVFECPACRSREIHGKTFVGGTIGAGDRERVPG